jgi:quercetin dioxygenase-like cupin family protein
MSGTEVLHHRANYLVRRLRLAPGQATPWHRDPFHRVTVVLSGDLLNIEFKDGGETHREKIAARQVDWQEPGDRVHRAVNVGRETYEEVTTFSLIARTLTRNQKIPPEGCCTRIPVPEL